MLYFLKNDWKKLVEIRVNKTHHQEDSRVFFNVPTIVFSVFQFRVKCTEVQTQPCSTNSMQCEVNLRAFHITLNPGLTSFPRGTFYHSLFYSERFNGVLSNVSLKSL